MPVSVVTIDVDDTRFKAFLERYGKYQELLKKMPASWNEAGAAGEGLGRHIADMTEALMAQQDLLKANNRQHKEAKKTTSSILNDTKKIAASIRDTTSSLLKWVGIGGVLSGAVAGIAGIGSLWGLDRLASGVGNTYRTSQGLGITSGQLQAANLTLGRYLPDVQGHLQTLSTAQSDAHGTWALSAMGIDPTGKNAAQLLAETTLRAKQMFDPVANSPAAQQFADAHGLTALGFSLNDLKTLHSTSTTDLQRSMGDYNTLSGQLNLDPATQRAWQSFDVALQTSENKIKNTFVDGLEPLIPQLTQLSSAVTDAIDTFMKSDTFKQLIPELATGIKGFADYISAPGFLQKVETFGDNIGILADKLVKALEWLHLIPDGDSGPDPRQRTAQQEASDINVSRTSVMASANLTKAEISTAKAFKAMGWTFEQGAGIAANLGAESGLNPFTLGDFDKKTGKYTAYGLGQWHKGRQMDYFKLFGHTMQSVTDRVKAFKEQLKFTDYELTKGKESRAGGDLRRAVSAAAAADVVSREYERPKKWAQASRDRGAQAQVIVHVNNNTGGNANVSANAAAAGAHH